MRNILLITDEEKLRILNLHESLYKKERLLKEEDGQTKAEYPPCVQIFGEPRLLNDNKYYILGTGNWKGYFFTKTTYYDPNSRASYPYYCRGNEIMQGNKNEISSKTAKKITNADNDWSLVANGDKVISLGSSGPLVKYLQGWLRFISDTGTLGQISFNPQKIGGPRCTREDSSKCDGVYGQTTMEAVKAYQKIRNINVDGIVGKQFYQMLYHSSVNPSPVSPQIPQTPKFYTGSIGGTEKNEVDFQNAIKRADKGLGITYKQFESFTPSQRHQYTNKLAQKGYKLSPRQLSLLTPEQVKNVNDNFPNVYQKKY